VKAFVIIDMLDDFVGGALAKTEALPNWPARAPRSPQSSAP